MTKRATTTKRVTTARKAARSTVRRLPTVTIDVAGGTIEVERGKLVDLLMSGKPVRGGAAVLDRVGSVTRLTTYSDSPAHHLENDIVEAVRSRIRKQLGSIEAADIDLGSIGAAEDLAESMASVLPASHPFDELVGPFYDTPSLRKWLGLTRQRLNQRVKSNQLLGCPLEDGGIVYPTWQFASNGAVIPGVGDVLSILSQGTNDNWQKALWFSTRSEQLSNQSPREWLLKGRRLEPVIEYATQTAARWGR
jgi:hypothetical protein